MTDSSDANKASLAGISPAEAGDAPAPKIKSVTSKHICTPLCAVLTEVTFTPFSVLNRHEWYQTESNVRITFHCGSGAAAVLLMRFMPAVIPTFHRAGVRDGLYQDDLVRLDARRRVR